MKNIRKKFSIFKNQKNLVYLDNGATTQICEPSRVTMENYLTKYRANVHRGLYDISVKATAEYESARENVAKFLNAEPKEIVFNSGTTAGLNFLAQALTPRLSHRDNVVITISEHHSNLVPWQQAAKHYGFSLRFIELDKNFRIDLADAKKKIDKNTKIVSFALVSNVLGTIAPAKELVALARSVRAFSIIDAAQASAHLMIDVKKINCDFLVFSGHKTYGPNGIGVLYGKKELLDEALEPVYFGGDMVSEVTVDGAFWAGLPQRFEAGTPNAAGAIGLGAACEFIRTMGWKNIIEHEKALTEYALKKLAPLVKIFGPANTKDRLGVISFTIPGIHPHDLADIVNHSRIAVRSGVHCAEPLHRRYRLPGTTRASFGIYNEISEIDRLVEALKKAQKIFSI